jgi:AmmeMemoRadiSam system protein B/AmmeMemoRadiSam system protein A
MEGLIRILFLPLLALPLFVNPIFGAEIKRPNVAGLFYPKEKKALEEMIDRFLVEAGPKKAKEKIVGLISPHAGYQYSGRIMAHGFKEIKGVHYGTVLIFGPAHYFPFRGASIISSGFYETPLGRVAIDEDIAKELMDSCKFVKKVEMAFEREHSVEVQIPFLQRSIENFRIVPVVMGDMTLEEHRILANTLFDLYEKKGGSLLSVFSTDMSHFHPYEEAKKIDSQTIRLIERGEIFGLIDGLGAGRVELCGFHPVILSLILSEIKNCEIRPLKYGTSKDSGGPGSSVVGYLSALILEPEEKRELDSEERRILLNIARRTLNEYVKTKKRPVFQVKEERLLEKEPVFVTLMKDGELRGCIGHTRPLYPLFEAVSEMTVRASSFDPRFKPVKEAELDSLEIEITIIGPLKRLNKINDITIGKHGLFVSLNGKSGLLLPQVAKRFKWDREEFLRETCIKAGLEPQAYRRKDARVYFFKGYSFSEGKKR